MPRTPRNPSSAIGTKLSRSVFLGNEAARERKRGLVYHQSRCASEPVTRGPVCRTGWDTLVSRTVVLLCVGIPRLH